MAPHVLLAASIFMPGLAAYLVLRSESRLSDTALTGLLMVSGCLNLAPMVVVLAYDWVSLIYRGNSELTSLAVLLAPVILSGLLFQVALFRAIFHSHADWTLGEYLWAKARWGFMGAFPVVISLVTVVTAVRLLPDLQFSLGVITVLVGGAVAVAFSVYPYLFRTVMGGRRLSDSPLRHALISLSVRARVPVTDIVVIPAGKPNTLNAWVSGLWPQHRVVFLTDALIERLSTLELEAVFAHELGHVRKGHLWLYLGYAIGSVALFTYAGMWLANWWPQVPALVPIRGALTGIVTVIGITFLSRRFEFSADQFSVSLIGNAEPVVAALEKLAAGRSGNKQLVQTWFVALLQTHPPLQERIHSLRRGTPTRR